MSKVLNQDISIGDNLRGLRCRAGFSQEKVAEKLQVMGFTISREIISVSYTHLLRRVRLWSIEL